MSMIAFLRFRFCYQQNSYFRPPQLPYVLRYYVDSLDISSNLVQEAAMFRLHFIFEDSSLFLCAAKSVQDVPLAAFVCLMRMGFFELTVTSTEPPENKNEPISRPLLELHARNDLLEIRTCADSLAALAVIAQYLANEGSAAAATSGSRMEKDDRTSIGGSIRDDVAGPVLNGSLDEVWIFISTKGSGDDCRNFLGLERRWRIFGREIARYDGLGYGGRDYATSEIESLKKCERRR